MPNANGMDFEYSTLRSVDYDDRNSLYEALDNLASKGDTSIALISRRPQKEVIRYLDITKSDVRWLTELEVEGSIYPQLEKISNFIENKIQSGKGIIVVEGLEWMKEMQGEDSLLVMARRLNDQILDKEWTILFLYNHLAFSSQWSARFKREAPMLIITSQESDVHEEEVNNANSEEELDETIEILPDGSPRLTLLTKLPESTFSIQLLRRRILQWRKMGLEVSELEPALYKRPNEAYAIYKTVEEKVRKVTEIERLIDAPGNNFDSTKRSIYRFQLRQLTSIDKIEKEIVEALSSD
ncbi:MAG: DUF835 domain-containing protein [Candidatus Poseidoniaceae archaeon]